MLDLSPETETHLETAAARAGVSVETLIRRVFVRDETSARATLPSGDADRVQNLLTEWQKEYGLPVPPGGFKTLAELSAQWQAEDAEMTDAERKFWAEHEQERDVSRLHM